MPDALNHPSGPDICLLAEAPCVFCRGYEYIDRDLSWTQWLFDAVC